MPIPGTSEAPKFDEHYLSDFLEDLELHFACTGVTDEDRQVNYITRYSTDKIRKQIGFLPELDRSKKNKTWQEAKTVLTEFYGDVDKPRPLSLAEFQAWVQQAADKPAFISKDQVNKYYSEFMAKGRPLLDNKQVSDNDLNFAFIQGVPSSMKAALRGLIPDAHRTRASPLEIRKTLELLRGLANKDDPTYEAWRYEKTAAEDTLVAPNPETIDDARTGQTQNAPTAGQPAAASGRQAAKSSSVEDQMDALMKQFSEMKIMLAQQAQNASQQQLRSPRCVMCGVTNAGHTMRSCPETARLVAEGRIYLDATKNRYVLSADGSELPRAPYNYDGGLAAFIRAQTPSPPTTRTTASSHGAGLVLANGALFSTLTNPYTAEAYPALRGGKEYENCFDPKKRPDDKPTPRQRMQDSTHHDQNRRTRTPAPPQTTHNHQPTPEPLPPAPSTPAPLPPATTIPEPPHLINRKDGWKQSQPGKGKGREVRFEEDEDVEMRDSSSRAKAKSNTPSTGYKHTTDLEKDTDANAVFDKLLKDVNVTLPLGQVLGTSAALQELMHEASKRRRVPKESSRTALLERIESEGDARGEQLKELVLNANAIQASEGPVPNTSKAEVLHFDATGVPIVQAEYTTASAFRDYILVNDGQDLTQQQLAFSTFALSRTKGLPAIQDRMFAMATGVFTTHVNGIPFRCMVDSGSELNVVYKGFPGVTGLALDSLGQFWKLKGIHGAAEPLAGYIDSVPFQIGRHTFEHHVFVSPHQTIGDSFDIILGQPFLTYFDARVDYSATGETVLYLWSGRDKDTGSHPTLGISITDPEDARNRSEILSHLHAMAIAHADETSGSDSEPDSTTSSYHSASIEELEEEDRYTDFV
ncbi:hypothetical protein L226DRAFT_569998 [Lentinus tigrinus ALCF2SS1-7]|uniref:DUF4100 domain-containing protein n=1 Tax=Lentinus tigrinus ALCF2SS1-6 TaxID=1328759 RepID=A0A5C2S9G5_9APHY|nr:hypothetical protein L227DRAFT_611045 [Lentinus tigrinus ALCF2SS1-6]RPD75747.1 hypothetical protein L226DRAFT_569998 [Lentinus tigrinus ALCF2SS1-7]